MTGGVCVDLARFASDCFVVACSGSRSACLPETNRAAGLVVCASRRRRTIGLAPATIAGAATRIVTRVAPAGHGKMARRVWGERARGRVSIGREQDVVSAK